MARDCSDIGFIAEGRSRSHKAAFYNVAQASISMFFLRVRLFGTCEGLGMRRHPGGWAQPRKQTGCLEFTGARSRSARGLTALRGPGGCLGAQLAPARRIAAGARGLPWRQKARLIAMGSRKLASGTAGRGANPNSVLSRALAFF
jgi:hypothetical protein